MSESVQDDLIITPVPALVALLMNLEKKKGSELTEIEVIEISDNAACIVMPSHAHKAVVEARGYFDIDPENAWQEWLNFKASLDEGEK
ncbi:MAG: hypothetical protein ABIQ97_02175 [Lysobacteraceae bacterium]